MSNGFEIATEKERELYAYLRSGPKRRLEIKKKLGMEQKEKQLNELLKEAENKGKIFRLEKTRKEVYYRLNDFPVDIKALLAFIDSLPSEHEAFLQLKENIIRYYPKLSIDRILGMTDMEVKASIEKDDFVKLFLKRFKDSL